MRYVYGTDDSYSTTRGVKCNVSQMASIIQRDVEFGKWNIYEGGETNNRTAHCRYKRNGFVYHGLLLIFGNEKEFKQLEELIKGVIEVIPRKFN